MIVQPGIVAKDVAHMLQILVDDLARNIPRGERKKFKITYFDCVPFIIEVVGTQAEAEQ